MNPDTSMDINLSKVDKILVIDDDLAILDILNVYLSNSGYDVHTASNGIEALNSFHILNPELIICDLRLPDIDGLELIEIFKDSCPDVPIIAFSGFGKIKDVTEAIRRGASDYLIKPIVDFDQFDNAIKTALIDQYQMVDNIYHLDKEVKDKVFQRAMLKSYSYENNELVKNLKFLNDDPTTARKIQLQLLPGKTSKLLIHIALKWCNTWYWHF